jgi:hypothetical protein
VNGTKKTPALAKLANKLADLFLEHEKLVEGLAKQRDKYRELRLEYH